MDSAIQHLAWIVIDKLYDELTAQGLTTGEIVTFAMFPETIEGHLP